MEGYSSSTPSHSSSASSNPKPVTSHLDRVETPYPPPYPMRFKHPIPNPYPCPYCTRSFPSPQALGGHQNAHRRDRTQLAGPQQPLPPPPPMFGNKRLTYRNKLLCLSNPNHLTSGPSRGLTNEERYNMWLNAPSYYFYNYYKNNNDNEIDSFFKNSYHKGKNVSSPSFTSNTAESHTDGRKERKDGNEVSSKKQHVVIDLTLSP